MTKTQNHQSLLFGTITMFIFDYGYGYGYGYGHGAATMIWCHCGGESVPKLSPARPQNPTQWHPRARCGVQNDFAHSKMTPALPYVDLGGHLGVLGSQLGVQKLKQSSRDCKQYP